MSVVAAATLSPTLGRQFNVLINAAVVLSMTMYGLCALALWRFAGAEAGRSRTLARTVAAASTLFCVWVIAASGREAILPALAIVVVAPLLWLLLRLRRKSAP
jgi:arginine:agmatine antiporter